MDERRYNIGRAGASAWNMMDESNPRREAQPISKLELRWTQRQTGGEPEPCLTFDVSDEAKEVTIRYAATFRVCATPRCSCHSVCTHCAPLSPDGTPSPARLHSFWLEVRERAIELTSELKADAETLRLAEFIQAGLSERAWEELHRWFWTAKIRAIETAEVSEIDLTGLPSAADGLMMPFVEMFPLGLSLYFTYEGASWAGDEQYCVQPGCKCTGLVLTFLQLTDAEGRKIPALRDTPALRYDYRSQATRELKPGPPGAPPTGQLLEALRAAHPQLDTRLELHHRIMQSLYARHYLG